jgi:hypothetical protein
MDTPTFPCEECLGPAEGLRRDYLGMMRCYRNMRAIDPNNLTPEERAEHARRSHEMSRDLIEMRRLLEEDGIDIPSLKEHRGRPSDDDRFRALWED